MRSPVSIVGHVCHCEWSGPATGAMVLSLLSALKDSQRGAVGAAFLILELDRTAAASIARSSSPFVSALPAIWDCCEELVVVAAGGPIVSSQLRRAICGSASMPIACLAKPISFFESLEEAFAHAVGVYPHDMLELQRQRVRDGSWTIKDIANYSWWT